VDHCDRSWQRMVELCARAFPIRGRGGESSENRLLGFVTELLLAIVGACRGWRSRSSSSSCAARSCDLPRSSRSNRAQRPQARLDRRGHGQTHAAHLQLLVWVFALRLAIPLPAGRADRSVQGPIRAHRRWFRSVRQASLARRSTGSS
jgi:hypothetical protein